MDIIWICHSSYDIASCCIALHWHMELCREPMVPTVPVQHRLLGITMQLHTLLGMKAGDMTFALHMHYDFGLWHICLGMILRSNASSRLGGDQYLSCI